MVEKVAGGERPDYKSGRSQVQSLFRLPDFAVIPGH